MVSRFRLAASLLLSIVALVPFAGRLSAHAGLPSDNGPVLSALDQPLPLSADRRTCEPSDSGARTPLVEFELVCSPRPRCAGYGNARVASRQRGFLDCVAQTLHSGGVRLQV